MQAHPECRSEDALLLQIMRRALARSDRELFGQRARYEARARQLADRLITPGCAPRAAA